MKTIAIGVSLLLSAAGLGAQQITDQDITAAIEQGRAGKKLEKTCTARRTNGFDFTVEGPLGRIMRAAREAKRDHRDFTMANVTPRMLQSVIVVSAQRVRALSAEATAQPLVAGQPIQAWVLPPEYDARTATGINFKIDFAIRSRANGPADAVVLRPARSVQFNDGKDRLYSPFPGASMSADFDLSAFRALPPGDVEVVAFMTDAGEQSCKITDKERRAIR